MKNGCKTHVGPKSCLVDRINEMCEIIRSTYEDSYAQYFEKPGDAVDTTCMESEKAWAAV